jgi:dolichol-phosphate mannosyltransferase
MEQSSGKPYFSLVVPTYNESENIASMVEQLTAVLTPVLGSSYELVVVDDDSPDRTWELAEKIGETDPRVRVVRRINERGLATAVIAGWRAANGEVLGVIDADLQHPPDVLVKLIREMQQGADIAIASRHVEGGGISKWSMARRLVSRTAQGIGLMLLPGAASKVSDPMSGYFLLRSALIENVTLRPVGYKILLEILARANPKEIREVGYVFREREKGGSKATYVVFLQYLQHLWRLRTSR